MRGHDHDARARVARPDRFRERDAVGPRHTEIDERDVGNDLGHERERRRRVLRLADHIDLVALTEEKPELVASERLVVDHHGSEGSRAHAALLPVDAVAAIESGSRTSARAPSSRTSSEMLAVAP